SASALLVVAHESPRAASFIPVAKVDEVHVATLPVLGCLEQIDDSLETGAACELRGDVPERHRTDRVDLDISRGQLVTAADLHVRTRPDAHAAGHFPLSNRVTQMLRKNHGGLWTHPSGSVTPDPPISLGISLNFGFPSRI